MAVTGDAHARLIGVAGAVLVASSLVGGVASVLAGTNTWADAWTAEATLAAPWPMLVLQTAATIAAVRPQRVAAVVGSSLLGLSVGDTEGSPDPEQSPCETTYQPQRDVLHGHRDRPRPLGWLAMMRSVAWTLTV